jgi:hypothetical protein
MNRLTKTLGLLALTAAMGVTATANAGERYGNGYRDGGTKVHYDRDRRDHYNRDRRHDRHDRHYKKGHRYGKHHGKHHGNRYGHYYRKHDGHRYGYYRDHRWSKYRNWYPMSSFGFNYDVTPNFTFVYRHHD